MRGKRIDRGIYRRGNVFDVRFSVGPRTARREISRTFKTLPEARFFYQVWQRDRQFETAGLKAPETRRPRLTLRAILDGYLEESKALGSDPDTIRAFAQLCNTIRRGLGDARRVPLAREDLVEFASWARTHTKTRGGPTVEELRHAVSRAFSDSGSASANSVGVCAFAAFRFLSA